MSGSSERKSKPATAQKLRKARREGSVPQAQKVVTLISVAALLGALILLIGAMRMALTDFFKTTFTLIGAPFDVALTVASQEIATALLKAALPLCGVAVVSVALVSIAYHRGIPFAIKPIVPDFKRLNPAQGFKRMLGRRSWIETGVGLVQLVMWVGIAAAIIHTQWRTIFHLYTCGLSCLDAIGWQIFRNLAVAAIILFVVLSAVEAVLQQALFAHEQRMTLSEYKREMKDSFGAPEIRKARAMSRAEDEYFNTVDPDQAGLEMANMCFFSENRTIAIRFHPEIAPVPIISAKGSGDEAQRIRRWIRDNGFPELQHRKIVDVCLSRPDGTPTPRSIHKELAGAIAKMFR